MSKGEKASSRDRFPEGLRILVVDSDSTSLNKIREMSLSCVYEVTTATTANEALSILRETRSKFDIAISDINILDMDPFEFIKIVAVNMDLPLVLMSNDDDNNTVVKGLNSGASDYLLKPIQINNIKFIWKHVVRKQQYKAMEQAERKTNIENCQKLSSDSENGNVIDNENLVVGCSSSGGVERDDEGIQKNEISRKKQRIVWTSQLHGKFVSIVDQIGIKDAVPKKILEMMNIPGLSRENVASHLQKYRLYLRKLEESKQQKRRMQAQAINLEFNPQTYSYNTQNQVHSNQNNFQHLTQRRSNSFGNISPLNQNLPENYLLPESRFGLPTDNGIIPPTFSLDQFSDFRIGDISDLELLDSSLAIERPLKFRKLSHDVASEATNDARWHSTTTFPSTTNDVSTRSSSQFCENEFPLQNSGRFTDNGITSYLQILNKTDTES